MTDTLTPKLTPSCTRERCASCQHIRGLGFSVPDDVWAAVVHPQFFESILCLPCFAERGDARLVNWTEGLQVWAVSLVTHLVHEGWMPPADRTPSGWRPPADAETSDQGPDGYIESDEKRQGQR